MTYAEMLLPEFDQEMASTRKVLERLPDDKFDWQAHPKSHTIGWNANHVVDIVNWLVQTLTKPSLDIAPVGGPRYEFPKLTSRQELLDLFDRNVTTAQGDHGDQGRGHVHPWSLLQGGKPFFTMPPSAVVRSVVLNHLMHHRTTYASTSD